MSRYRLNTASFEQYSSVVILTNAYGGYRMSNYHSEP